MTALVLILASCTAPGESSSEPPETEPAETEPADTGSVGAGSSSGSDLREATDADPAGSETPGGEWLVVEVTDGDTIDVEGRNGFEEVRLIGINTPESGECLYQEATDALAEMVDGEFIDLVTDTTDHDQYGRLLRYVEVSGVDAGAAMISDGYALARRYEPDTARSEEYAARQAAAQAAGLGLWSADACGTATIGVDVALRVEADAPGDDNDNLNGEWIEITNDSPADLDLDGWQLADESASHRYDFGDVVLPAGATLIVLTGCGRDRDLQLYWCNTDSSVWNNSGDTAFLRDPNGNLVAFEPYGDSA